MVNRKIRFILGICFRNTFENSENEIEYIAQEINRIVETGMLPNEIAVVGRTNGQIKEIVTVRHAVAGITQW